MINKARDQETRELCGVVERENGGMTEFRCRGQKASSVYADQNMKK